MLKLEWIDLLLGDEEIGELVDRHVFESLLIADEFEDSAKEQQVPSQRQCPLAMQWAVVDTAKQEGSLLVGFWTVEEVSDMSLEFSVENGDTLFTTTAVPDGEIDVHLSENVNSQSRVGKVE